MSGGKDSGSSREAVRGFNARPDNGGLLPDSREFPADSISVEVVRIALREAMQARLDGLQAGERIYDELVNGATARAEQIVADARAEADRILAEARSQAERILRDSRSQADRTVADAVREAKALQVDATRQAWETNQALVELRSERSNLERRLWDRLAGRSAESSEPPARVAANVTTSIDRGELSLEVVANVMTSIDPTEVPAPVSTEEPAAVAAPPIIQPEPRSDEILSIAPELTVPPTPLPAAEDEVVEVAPEPVQPLLTMTPEDIGAGLGSAPDAAPRKGSWIVPDWLR